MAIRMLYAVVKATARRQREQVEGSRATSILAL